jgi:hypothetical protein
MAIRVGVKGDMGMSLFKDFADGVEGTSEEVISGGSSGVSGSPPLIDAAGWVSSTICGKSSTSVGFKVLPGSPTIPVADLLKANVKESALEMEVDF